MLFIATIGWWGFVYPELSAVAEGYVQESPDGEACAEDPGQMPDGEAAPDQTGKDSGEAAESQVAGKTGDRPASLVEMLVEGLGGTGIKNGNVRIKSRVMEYLYQGKERGTTEKESGYDRQECAHRGV